MTAITDALGMRPLEDAAAAYQRAPNAATGTGAAIREAVVGGASQGMEKAANLGQALVNVGAPARGAISDFVSGLATGPNVPPPQPAPAPKPAPGLAPTSSSPPGAPGASGGGWTEGYDPAAAQRAAAAGVADASQPALAGASAPGMDTVRRTVHTIITPEATPAAPVDSQKQVLDLLNNGTWSGMQGAHALARRIDADRTQQNALTNEDIARQNANTSATTAAANTTLSNAQAERATAGAQNERLDAAGKAADLQTRKEMRALELAAASGDEKAAAKLRNLKAAQAGKSPEEAVNERLLDAYLKSTAEFNKDPSNMGKAAPAFNDFLGSLPPQMFPNVSKFATQLPPGMKKQVGMSGGKPVYEDGAGKRFVSQ